ncbi:MAG TPA: efflux RND transporter permease subunit, partial [Vicinamibacterales bacterium]|nr:efflux RND transporter permease subunit [Vicinamibacterales bacterium]
MWIVRVALNRPYTFVVLALLILGIGPLTIVRTPVDIFPNIDIPVIAVIWNYGGLSADEMSNRVTSIYERLLTTAVNDVEHVESQSLRGIGVVKIFFQPGAKIDLAVAQVTAASQAILRQLPTGITPPFILTYNASTVPVIQLALSSNTLSEQQITDLGLNFMRPQLASIAGAQLPFPYGGKQAQVQVDLDPNALQSKGLSPTDVVNAIAAQNLILPSGTEKIGSHEYDVSINASPDRLEELNDLPIRSVGTATIYVRDVAHVRNGYPPQTNIVRVDGHRAVLMSIQKIGNASTLDIIQEVRNRLPRIQATLPPGLDVHPIGDQSLFVRASITGVLREALVAACLTALMILIFLGSWRSTLIIAVSIPLSILTSIICLSALGETINIMTLGGLALAVGILVDDATVAIENINVHLEEGKDLEPAILEGAHQIAIPAFVSTICICIVFVPMFFLTGVARYLFVPMAEAVVFAMLASYVLSRTLVPTMAKYLLKTHAHDTGSSSNPFVRIQRAIDRGFLALRDAYRAALATCVEHRRLFIAAFLGACALSLVLTRWVGEDFFPAVDGGQFKLHLRAPTGTRIEETAALTDRVEDTVRRLIPDHERSGILDNIGLPYSGINLSYSTSAPIGPSDADIIVSLAESHQPTAKYIHDLRQALPNEFPGTTFSFVPADIVTQILNFGLPSPIDIQIVGRNVDANRKFASTLVSKLSQVPGIADLHLQQAFNQPQLQVAVDRSRAAEIGVTERDVA